MNTVPRRVAASIALGTLLNPLNSSMIAVALLDLQHEFRVGVAASSWLISGFYLAASVAQPLMGRLADRYGPRRVYLVGLAIVCATGVAVLFAPGFGWVVAARVVQAVGTSAAFPAGLALIRRLMGGSRPPVATLGAISVANSASAAFGPVLGGFLVSWAGWQGIFAVNVPVTVLGIVVALRWLPSDRVTASAAGGVSPGERSVATGARSGAPAGEQTGEQTGSAARRLAAELDVPGLLLFSATVVCLLGFLLSVGAQPTWLLLALVPVATGALIWRELRAATPFLDVRALAGNGPLVGVLGQQIATQAAFYSVFYGLPLWLEQVRGYSAQTSGLLMLPVAALGVAVTPVAARLAGRLGPRLPLVIGSLGLLVGGLALLLVGDATPVAGIVGVATVLGLPNGFNNMGLQALLYSSAPAEQTGTAAGLFQTGRYVGAILSTATLGIVFEKHLTSAGLHKVGLVVAAIAVLLVIAAWFAGRRRQATPARQPMASAAARGSSSLAGSGEPNSPSSPETHS
ncbi:MAG TPA: MFS transporter [Micromonosporaceae bacterium]